MQAGYAKADITPQRPITLCGFAARCNRVSEGVDDPLQVHALVIEHGGECVLVMVFDLLGLGPKITESIHRAMDSVGIQIPRTHRILCCTHTHSAPAAIKLIGCGIIEQEYCDQVVTAAATAAKQAVASMRDATVSRAIVRLPHHNYNRRTILKDGRVVMSVQPSALIQKTGPVWDEAMFIRFEDGERAPIACICNWAAHALTVAGNKISADFPGEFCRQLSLRLSMPFLYLQGACGNLNPPFKNMTRDEMLENVNSLIDALAGLKWEAVQIDELGLNDRMMRLKYDKIQTSTELQSLHENMRLIALTGDGPQRFISELTNVLNVEPGQKADQKMLRYIASILERWSGELIENNKTKDAAGCDLNIKVMRLGDLIVCFCAAEIFAETALHIRQLFPQYAVGFTGYASPLVGYIPTDEALKEGGYEVDYAYRFYGHPSVFAEGSEPLLVKNFSDMITSFTHGR